MNRSVPRSAGLEGFVLNLRDVVWRGDSFLPQQHVQLGGMSVNVTQVVDQQFQKAAFAPSKSAPPLSGFVGQRLNRRPAFRAAVLK